MDVHHMNPALRDELLSLCQKEQARALAEGRRDGPDCGCLEERAEPEKGWFRWV